MPQRRAARFRILPAAWQAWERVTVPGRLEAVIDALFALADTDVTLARLHPALPVWQLSALHAGMQFYVVGARDESGAWVHVVAVTGPLGWLRMSPEDRPWPTCPIPSMMWMGEENAPPLGALLQLRPVRTAHTALPFGLRGGVYICIGTDGRPSSVMLFHGLSARAALHVLRLLAEGSTGVATDPETLAAMGPEPAYLPLDASPALWAWLCTALGGVCARLPLLPDESLLLPTAAA